MAAYISVGTNSHNEADDLVTLTVRPGDSVKVVILTGGTVKAWTAGHKGGPSGTVSAAAIGSTYTTAGTHYLTCAGRADLKITGGLYGG